MRTIRQNELTFDEPAAPLALRKNLLLEPPAAEPLVNLEKIRTPSTIALGKREYKRELRDARRLESAEAAIAGFGRRASIYGFTKGQFSLIQLITAALKQTGPAELTLSTWTAANADVSEVLAFCNAGVLTGARWLVDLTFSRRSPELAQRIRDVFGADAIRVAKNHAKFALIGNAAWRVVIRTSMNLNHNPRFENFEIAHDPELYGFHAAIVDEVWRKQSRQVEGMRPYEIQKHFDLEL
jgi:hypothetical protein